MNVLSTDDLVCSLFAQFGFDWRDGTGEVRPHTPRDLPFSYYIYIYFSIFMTQKFVIRLFTTYSSFLYLSKLHHKKRKFKGDTSVKS